MTDRGLPSVDGSPACPFVAFEDDRDERADRPDHRHRCFAEAEPAPRALAHQEAYCLSSAFPVCPTFQEWARREAAHAQPGGAVVAAGAPAAVAAGGAAAEPPDSDDGADDDLGGQARDETPIEERPRRNPPRDWAAPPPWAGGSGGGGAGAGRRGEGSPDATSGSPGPPEEPGRGLAGSAADRLARGGDVGQEWGGPRSSRPRSAAPDSPAAPPDPELAGLVGRAPRGSGHDDTADEVVPPSRPGRRPAVSSTRDRGRERDRDRERERLAGDPGAHQNGPSWERQRRFEAYPTIKTRARLSGFPAVPTVAVLFGGLILAAIALFFLPALLGVGGRDGNPAASPNPSVVVSTPSLEPTPVPAPTPQIYVIKSGDTLSRIAREFGLTLDQLLEANKDRISNPNRIAVGDEIIIPAPPTEEVPGAASPSPSASP